MFEIWIQPYQRNQKQINKVTEPETFEPIKLIPPDKSKILNNKYLGAQNEQHQVDTDAFSSV